MSTYTSTLATANKDARELHAGDLTINGTFTNSVTQSAATVYRLLPLPKGAVISDCTISTSGGGSGTIDVGVTEDADILIDGAAATSAGLMTIQKMNVDAGYGYTTLTPTWLIATQATVVSASTGTILRFQITYHSDNP